MLGSLEVTRDGEPLLLGGERQRTLLALLLIRANELVAADQLVELLFGGRRSDSGLNAVRVAVSRLRRALAGPGDETLVTRAGGYVLEVGPEQLDAAVFEAKVRQADELLAADDAHGAASHLREALGLWRGAPFADLSRVEDVQPEVRRLEELRLQATMARIDAELALGGGAALVGELEQLIADEPLQERLRGQLMRALYRAGRQADALAAYRQTSEHLREELGLEPSSALQDLERQILQQDPALLAGPASGARVARVPAPTNAIIGREAEIVEVAGLVARADVRLLTLLGPGGVGKTRLAIAAARALAPDFSEEVAWIELAGVARPQDVASTLSQALDVTPLPGENVPDALCRVLSDRQLLLAIDNFEHVLEAATLVGELLHGCPAVTILATSRQPLGLAAEHCYVVDPLTVPDPPEQATVEVVEATSATAMFVAAARHHNARFAVTPDSAAAVTRVCARLDGLPLAIELAAARTRLLGVEELAARLESRLSVLGTGPRDAPLRQRTLQATIDWSYQLLDTEQRRAFGRMAVFAGGATIHAAEEVTGATLETIEALIARSLVARRQSNGATRLLMLETVREYALARLEDDPERDGIRRRHLLHYLRLVWDTKPELSRTRDPDVLTILDREIDNIRTALQWGIENAPDLAVKLAGALEDYWWVRQDPDAVSWIDAALEAGDHVASAEDRAAAQLTRAWLLGQRGQPKHRAAAANTALELYRQLGDHIGISSSLQALAASAMNLGEAEQERAYAEQACTHARASGDDATLGIALARLARTLPAPEHLLVLDQARELLERIGHHRHLSTAYMNAMYKALEEGRPAEALDLLEVAETAAEKLTDPGMLGMVCGNAGLAHLFLGDFDRAREDFRREIFLCGQETFRYGVEEGLLGLAAIAGAEGSAAQAATLIGAADEHGLWLPADRVVRDRLEETYLAPARATLGTEAWRRAVEVGATMTYDQAIAYALDVSGREQPTPQGTAAAAHDQAAISSR